MVEVPGVENGGHDYDDEGGPYCVLRCGCWATDTNSGGPDGIDPLGRCPNNPVNRKEKGEIEVKKTTLNELVEKPLIKFTIKEMTEVYRTDVDGRKDKSIGYFKNPDIAEAFAQNQADGTAYNKITQAFVLTDGVVGFLFSGESVHLIDDEKEALRLREAAIKQLSPAQRKLLKL